jgi:hypothetical protein
MKASSGSGEWPKVSFIQATIPKFPDFAKFPNSYWDFSLPSAIEEGELSGSTEGARITTGMTLLGEILVCPYMFVSGLLLIGTSFFKCFRGVPLIRPFFIIVGLLMIGLSLLVAAFVFLCLFMSGVAVA